MENLKNHVNEVTTVTKIEVLYPFIIALGIANKVLYPSKLKTDGIKLYPLLTKAMFSVKDIEITNIKGIIHAKQKIKKIP